MRAFLCDPAVIHHKNTLRVSNRGKAMCNNQRRASDSQRIQLTVPEGNTLVFLRKPSPQAMPVVKQVTFTAR